MLVCEYSKQIYYNLVWFYFFIAVLWFKVLDLIGWREGNDFLVRYDMYPSNVFRMVVG